KVGNHPAFDPVGLVVAEDEVPDELIASAGRQDLVVAKQGAAEAPEEKRAVADETDVVLRGNALPEGIKAGVEGRHLGQIEAPAPGERWARTKSRLRGDRPGNRHGETPGEIGNAYFGERRHVERAHQQWDASDGFETGPVDAVKSELFRKAVEGD